MSVRFAVVGCGNAARQIHLPALRAEGVDVTVFASRSRASAESLRDEWGGGAVVDHWEDAVARDDVDAVVDRGAERAAPRDRGRGRRRGQARAGRQADGVHHRRRRRDDRGGRARTASCSCRSTTRASSRRSWPRSAFVADGRLGAVTGFRAAFGHAGPQAWAPRADWFFDGDAVGRRVPDRSRRARRSTSFACVTGDDIVGGVGGAQRPARRRRGRRRSCSRACAAARSAPSTRAGRRRPVPIISSP